MTHEKVILTEHLDEEAASWLAEKVLLVRHPHTDSAGVLRELADADGLLVRTYTQVNEHLLQHAPKLRVIGRAGVGLDNIDLLACQQRRIPVVYTPDANTQAVVEYAWSLLLPALRPYRALDETVTSAQFHEYRKILVGHQLGNRTLGILGMGRIGRRMAQVAQAFGIRVIYNDLLSPSELGLSPADSSEFVNKTTLWTASDILSIHTDGRPDNYHLINADVLSQLRPHCTLLNTARGMLIDPEALAVWAKRTITTGGQALLDVHDPEPPQPNNPLWGLPNVRLFPHLASRTTQAMANMSWVVRDVWRVLSGQPPQYPAPDTLVS